MQMFFWNIFINNVTVACMGSGGEFAECFQVQTDLKINKPNSKTQN